MIAVSVSATSEPVAGEETSAGTASHQSPQMSVRTLSEQIRFTPVQLLVVRLLAYRDEALEQSFVRDFQTIKHYAVVGTNCDVTNNAYWALQAVVGYYEATQQFPSKKRGLIDWLRTTPDVELGNRRESVLSALDLLLPAYRDDTEQQKRLSDPNVLLEKCWKEIRGDQAAYAITEFNAILTSAAPKAAADKTPHGYDAAVERFKEITNWGPHVIEEEPKISLTMPENCIPLDSKLGDLARTLGVPLGWAWPTMTAVAAASGDGVEDQGHHVFPAVFVWLLGAKGAGKTTTLKHALGTIFIDRTTTLKRGTPASDVGLIEWMPKDGGKPTLLVMNEGRDMMAKTGIQNNSSLLMKLCDLWDDGLAANHTKGKNNHVSCDTRMSSIGGLAINSREEFSALFGAGTVNGYADRCIFGVGEPIDFNPPELRCLPYTPKPSRVTADCFALRKAWVNAVEGRNKRLGELALRCALIWACFDELPEVPTHYVEAALRMMEWQELIRTYYVTSEGVDKEARCTEAIERAMDRSETGFKWNTEYRNKHWGDQFGARTCQSVRDALVKMGVAIYAHGVMKWVK